LTGPGWIPTDAEGLPQTRAAIEYARCIHAGQHRSDGAPFVLHPLEVAALLKRVGAPDHVIAAGVLHDVIEKTDATAADLRERFGPEITNLVLAVSDNPDIRGYAARKAALRRQVATAGPDALTLFAADKVSKLRELRREMAGDPGGHTQVRARRLRHYQRSLALLEERLAASPLVGELRAELTTFRASGQLATAHTD
jgi:(p)ppGpp synthase/HD superfamily hydrolase